MIALVQNDSTSVGLVHVGVARREEQGNHLLVERLR